MTLDELVKSGLISKLQPIEIRNFEAYDGKNLLTFIPFDLGLKVHHLNPIFNVQKEYLKYRNCEVHHLFVDDNKLIAQLIIAEVPND